MKYTWKVLINLLNYNRYLDIPDYITHENQDIISLHIIASKINEYFTSITPSLFKSILALPLAAIDKHLNYPNPHRFFNLLLLKKLWPHAMN